MATLAITSGLDNLAGVTASVIDYINVNAASDFTSGDTIPAGPGGEANTDILRFLAGGSFTLTSANYPHVTGIEDIGLGNYAITITVDDTWLTAGNHFSTGTFKAFSETGTNSFPISITANLTGHNVFLETAAGPDTLMGGSMPDTLSGGDGDDSLNGAANTDSVHGGSGADTLRGGGGAGDTIWGDDGDDILIDPVGGMASGDSYVGGNGADTLILEGAGAFSGLSVQFNGVESISGGAGVDDQSFVVQYGHLAIGGGQIAGLNMGPGADRIDVRNVVGGTFSVSSLNMVGVESLWLNPSSALNVVGVAGASNTVAVSGAYNHTLVGGGDVDLLFGCIGQDCLSGGAGADTLLGMSVSDKLFGGSGGDLLYGGSGVDTLAGGSGGDRLVGGMGGDSLHGDVGADTLWGGDGPDTLVVAPGDLAGDILLGDMAGESGQDSMIGGGGADTLAGGVGDDRLRGEGGGDVLVGGQGSDTLWGGDDGATTGDNAADTLWGEAGVDRFVFVSGFGVDLIADFETGVDKIELLSFSAFSTFSSLLSVATITAQSNGVVVSFGAAGTLQIVGPTTLSAGDFII